MTLNSRATRLIAIAVAAICVQLAAATAASADLIGASGTASQSPQPTPCPSDVTATLCELGGGAPPAGSSSPSPSPAHSSSPNPSHGGAAPAPAPPGAQAGPPGHPGSSSGATPSPSSAAALDQTAARFQNAPFLGALLDILSHPTSAEHPDLRHFRLPGAAAAATLGRGPGGGSAPAASIPVPVQTAPDTHRGSLAIPLICALLAAVAATVAVRGGALGTEALRRGRLRVRRAHVPLRAVAKAHSPRVRAGAAAGLVVALGGIVAVVANAASGAGTGSPARSTVPVSGVAGPGPHLREEIRADQEVVTAALVSGPPAWTRLVTIEQGLTAQQDELAAQERAIRRLAASVTAPVADDDRLPTTGGEYADRTNTLAALVAAHTATDAAYRTSLKAEYDLYRSAAQSPPQREQLVAAAATAPVPEAKEAVAYNLGQLQTQLNQEQAIALAEQRLQTFGSLSGLQLEAIRHHQPFIAPEVAPVTQGFGPTDFSMEPPITYHGVFHPHFHTGLDLGGPLGTPLHAAADGVVILATASLDDQGHLVGYGNYVLIAHPDGFETLYGHLDALAVKAGDVVRQGQIVGFEGSTGWSTGPHLHFEIRHSGEYLDPVPYLAGQLPA